MLRVGCGRRTLINRVLAPSPSFLLNFADLGSGQVSTLEAASASSATFTRATTAWTKLSTGLWASVSSGTPRSFYGGLDTTVESYLGYLAEGARTNSCLQARDFSNASWTKSSVTAAKDQAGIDGVANSASSLTATGANGTATQALTIASAAKTVSFFIKRISGTGAVQISLDNFATNTDVTSSINSSTYTQVSMTQTLANPTVGIKLVTSGDKIAVDMAQLEDGASFASTPIPTTTGSVTRNADVLTYPTSPWLNAAEGSLVSSFATNTDANITKYAVSINDESSGEAMSLGLTVLLAFQQVFDGSVLVVNQTVGSNFAVGVVGKVAGAFKLNDFAVSAGGSAVASDTVGTMPTVTRIEVGSVAGATHIFGPIRHIAYFPRRLPDGVLQQMTSQ